MPRSGSRLTVLWLSFADLRLLSIKHPTDFYFNTANAVAYHLELHVELTAILRRCVYAVAVHCDGIHGRIDVQSLHDGDCGLIDLFVGHLFTFLFQTPHRQPCLQCNLRCKVTPTQGSHAIGNGRCCHRAVRCDLTSAAHEIIAAQRTPATRKCVV